MAELTVVVLKDRTAGKVRKALGDLPYDQVKELIDDWGAEIGELTPWLVSQVQENSNNAARVKALEEEVKGLHDLLKARDEEIAALKALPEAG